MSLHIKIIITLALCLGASPVALAQAPQEANRAKQNDQTKTSKAKSFDFESDHIQGELPAFSQFRETVKQDATQTNLIKIRRHFLSEIIKQSDDL